MSRGPSDRDLDRLLGALPRETASPGFSRRVLQRLEAPGARQPAVRGWLLAAVAAGLALAAGLWLLARPAPPPAAADPAVLAEEHRRLVSELQALKASLQASEPPPVLYLGGTESVDLVLDLRPLWRNPEAAIRPAATRPGDPPPAAPANTGDRR